VLLHDLPHAAATLLLASGFDLRVIGGLLGHSKMSTMADVWRKVRMSSKSKMQPYDEASGAVTYAEVKAGKG
jgi:site-specific recombinase XerD